MLHPKRLEGDNLEHTDALIILSMIMGLMVTLLLATRFLLVAQPGRVRAGEGRVAPARDCVLGHMMSPGAAIRAATTCSGGRTRCSSSPS